MQRTLFDIQEIPATEPAKPLPPPPHGLHHVIVMEWGRQRRALGLPEIPDAPGLKMLQKRLETANLEPEQAAQGVRDFFQDGWTMSHCGCSLSTMCQPARWDRFFVQGVRRASCRKSGQFLSRQSSFESDEAFWGEEP